MFASEHAGSAGNDDLDTFDTFDAILRRAIDGGRNKLLNVQVPIDLSIHRSCDTPYQRPYSPRVVLADGVRLLYRVS